MGVFSEDVDPNKGSCGVSGGNEGRDGIETLSNVGGFLEGDGYRTEELADRY